MQSVSSSIWSRVAVSISYDDNHKPYDTTSTSKHDDKLLVKLELFNFVDLYLQIIYLICMNKLDLALNNPQCFICHQT